MLLLKGTWIGAALACAAVSHAISLTSFDDFEDGTVGLWEGGATETNVNGGGPGGATDRFMRVTSGTTGRWATFNNSPEWTGNWLEAGVTKVRFWARNFGTIDSFLRIVFHGDDSNRFTSTTAVQLRPSDGWRMLEFSTASSALTQVLGSGDYATTMQNVFKFMVRHDPGAPSANGVIGAQNIGLDRIQAVPEPTTMIALGLGCVGLLRRKKPR